MIQHSGVRTPEHQSTERAPALEVTNITRLEPVLVEYGDERGYKVTTIAFVAGNKAFIPPNGAQWTTSFRSFAKALNTQIIDKLAASSGKGGPVPAADVVDVVGENK